MRIVESDADRTTKEALNFDAKNKDLLKVSISLSRSYCYS